MNCLAIDTTNSRLTVVLIKDGDTFYREIEVGKSGHSCLLMPTVDEVLKKGEIGVNALDTVCAVVGPGSFTGIRIGVSAATAIAYATGARRIGVTSFELIAYNRGTVKAAVDAGHGNAYVALCGNGKILKTDFVNASDAQSALLDAEFAPVCDVHTALAEVVRNKIASEDYCDVLVPYYMRKSQAEREKDEV